MPAHADRSLTVKAFSCGRGALLSASGLGRATATKKTQALCFLLPFACCLCLGAPPFFFGSDSTFCTTYLTKRFNGIHTSLLMRRDLMFHDVT